MWAYQVQEKEFKESYITKLAFVALGLTFQEYSGCCICYIISLKVKRIRSVYEAVSL